MKNLKQKLLVLFWISTGMLATAQVGQPMPAVKVLTLDSQAVDANTLLTPGKLTMVIIWNSMMRPAHAELDSLHLIYQEWQEKYGLEIIAIASEYPKFKNTNLKKYLAKRSYSYRIYYDESQKFMGAWHPRGLPATYFLDKNGIVQHVLLGYDPGDEVKYEEKLIELSK